MYYIKMTGYNVLNEEIEMQLCKEMNKKTTRMEWRRPWFHRNFEVVLFDSREDALAALIELESEYNEAAKYTFLYDSDRIVKTENNESYITSFEIKDNELAD